MNNSNNQNSLNNLFNAIDDFIFSDLEASKEVILEEGYDVNQITKKGLDFIKKLQANAKIEIAKSNHNNLIEMAKKKVNAISLSASDAKKHLVSILLGKNPELQANYNSLKELNEHDILEMLNENQLLDFLDNNQEDLNEQ